MIDINSSRYDYVKFIPNRPLVVTPNSFTDEVLQILQGKQKAAENPNPGDFSFFPRLPQELQLKIWELAALQRRIVTIFAKKDPISAKSKRGSNHGILGACYISRMTALKLWDYTKVEVWARGFSEPQVIYLSKARDIIQIVGPNLPQSWLTYVRRGPDSRYSRFVDVRVRDLDGDNRLQWLFNHEGPKDFKVLPTGMTICMSEEEYPRMPGLEDELDDYVRWWLYGEKIREEVSVEVIEEGGKEVVEEFCK